MAKQFPPAESVIPPPDEFAGLPVKEIARKQKAQKMYIKDMATGVEKGAQKGTKSMKVKTYARGGGVESRGKTRGRVE